MNYAVSLQPPVRPLPEQIELLPVGSDVALLEYRDAFNDESIHLPEIAIRYFIYLVLSNADIRDIRAFACSMRLELNGLRSEFNALSHSALEAENQSA